MFCTRGFLKTKLFLKLGIFFNSYISGKRTLNFNNYIIGIRSTRLILNINKSIFLLYRILLFLQQVLITGGKILFIEKSKAISSLLSDRVHNTNQFCINGVSWLPGSLTNFTSIRWQYVLSNTHFFYQVPQVVVLLNFDGASRLILKEISTMKLPLITFCNFNLATNQNISYPLLANFLLKFNTYVFFSEIFFFFIFSFRSVNKLNQKLLNKRKRFIKQNYHFAIIRYRRFFCLNQLKRKLYKKHKDIPFKTKKPKFVRYNKKKWFKHKLRKYKIYTIYRKKFIVGGHFAIKLKYNAQRLYLLKRIFFNFFDWQYNFYSMSRKVRRRSLFHKFRLTKKCKRNFTHFMYYASLFERQIVFVLKKVRFVKSIKQGVGGLFKKYFFVNNQAIVNPHYLIGNDTIIQKKIYSSSLLFALFRYKKKHLKLLQK